MADKEATLRVPASEGRYKLVKQSKWIAAVEATGVDDADNSGNRIRNPATSMSDTAIHPKVKPFVGGADQVLIRLKYDDGLTAITNPVVQVFGFDAGGNAVMLRNKAGTPSDEITLSTDTTNDLTDGTNNYTSITDAQVVELLGATEIQVGIKTPLSGTGDATTAVVEVLFIDDTGA